MTIAAVGLRCTGVLGFDDANAQCTETATRRVTIRNAGPSFNCHRAPRCASCARIDSRIVAKYYPAGTCLVEPIDTGYRDAGRVFPVDPRDGQPWTLERLDSAEADGTLERRAPACAICGRYMEPGIGGRWICLSDNYELEPTR